MEYTLRNGRKYKITNTGKPYRQEEYPPGGFTIHGWNPTKQRWDFIDDSPDMDCVANFLKAAERNDPLN
jgi:hypothetical protein